MTKEIAEWVGRYTAEFIAQLGTHNAQVMEEMKRPLPRIGGPGYKWVRLEKKEDQE